MENSKKIYHALMADHIDFVSDDLDSAKRYLKENNVDIDIYLAKSKKRFKKLQFKMAAVSKKKAIESLFAKAVALAEADYNKSKSVLLGMLRAKAPDVQFRKLEELNEEEIKEILREVDLLQFIDKMSGSEKKYDK